MRLFKQILIYILSLCIYIVLGLIFLQWWNKHYLQDVAGFVAIVCGILTGITGWFLNKKL